jgi:outer membrane protein OmpA-like peptidoglycan-associated protein
MKVLIIGAVLFLGWSSTSTYLYVCRIKNLCLDDISEVQLQETPVEAEASLPATTLPEEPEATNPEEIESPGSFTVHHEYDRVEFIPTEEFSSYTEQLLTYVQQSSAPITVVGYTDARGQDSYNLRLSQLRAEEVKKYLITRGIDATLINVQSKGESNPLSDNATDKGRYANRRTEIILPE